VYFQYNKAAGVTKYHTICTALKHGPFRDLFIQISTILQQPAGMTVSKGINLQSHRAFEPLVHSKYTCFVGWWRRHGRR